MNVAQTAGGGVPPLLTCFGTSFASETKGILSLPFLVFLCPALALVFWRVGRCLQCKPGVSTLWGAPPSRVLSHAVIALSFLLWPTVTKQALRVLDCSMEVGGGERFVASDLRQQCGTPEHDELKAYALFTLCTSIPFVPIASALFLRHNKAKLQDTAFKERFFFLC